VGDLLDGVIFELDAQLTLGLAGRGGGRCGESGHGVAVLAGVGGELLARQLPARPARVERMVEHVALGTRGVETIPKAHATP
jgi:hypothetical protein